VAQRRINYYYAPLGAVPVSGWVALFDEPPEQHFFPLPLRQHCIAPASLLHIFATLSLQHFLSQPPLQHFSPLHAPCLAIGQLAPIGVCGVWAKVRAVKTSSNDRKLNILFMEISLLLRKRSQIEPQGSSTLGLLHLRERKERFRSGRPGRECILRERLQFCCRVAQLRRPHLTQRPFGAPLRSNPLCQPLV